MSRERATLLVSAENEALRLEAQYLHLRLFGRDPSKALIDAYLHVHADIPELGTADSEQLRTVRVIVTRHLDPLGLEPWLRNGNKRHALSIKLLLLSYLSECDANHPEFVRCRNGKSHTLLSMGLTSISAIFALFRGRFQMAWHGLL
jgi:hypothetical protein